MPDSKLSTLPAVTALTTLDEFYVNNDGVSSRVTAPYLWAALLEFGTLVGKQALWIPASAMLPPLTSGAGLSQNDSGVVTRYTVDFNPATTEYAEFYLAMPESWNEGTVTAKFFWSHPSTSVNFAVVFGIAAQSFSDGDAIGTFGTAVEVTDTGGTTDNVYISDETGAVTIGGTPVQGDLAVFRVYRDAPDAADSLAVDARLVGIVLYLTTESGSV